MMMMYIFFLLFVRVVWIKRLTTFEKEVSIIVVWVLLLLFWIFLSVGLIFCSLQQNVANRKCVCQSWRR